MNFKEFSNTMEEFDRIIRKCLKCNYNPKCPMHKISKYVQEIGKTEFLSKLKEIGLKEIEKELNKKELGLNVRN